MLPSFEVLAERTDQAVERFCAGDFEWEGFDSILRSGLRASPGSNRTAELSAGLAADLRASLKLRAQRRYSDLAVVVYAASGAGQAYGVLGAATAEDELAYFTLVPETPEPPVPERVRLIHASHGVTYEDRMRYRLVSFAARTRREARYPGLVKQEGFSGSRFDDDFYAMLHVRESDWLALDDPDAFVEFVSAVARDTHRIGSSEARLREILHVNVVAYEDPQRIGHAERRTSIRIGGDPRELAQRTIFATRDVAIA